MNSVLFGDLTSQLEELKLFAQKYEYLRQIQNELESEISQLLAEREGNMARSWNSEGGINRRQNFMATKL